MGWKLDGKISSVNSAGHTFKVYGVRMQNGKPFTLSMTAQYTPFTTWASVDAATPKSAAGKFVPAMIATAAGPAKLVAGTNVRLTLLGKDPFAVPLADQPKSIGGKPAMVPAVTPVASTLFCGATACPPENMVEAMNNPSSTPGK